MISYDQTSTVKRLEAEGWVIVPSDSKVLLGGPIAMERDRPDGTVDRVLVIPNGEIKANDR